MVYIKNGHRAPRTTWRMLRRIEGLRIPLQFIKEKKVAPEKLPAPAEGTPCTFFCDGASRKYPGRAGAGTVLYDGSLVNVEPRDNAREFLGLRSNNLAEYCAVILDSGLSALNYFRNHRLRVHHPPVKVLKDLILAAIRTTVREALSLHNLYKRNKHVIPEQKLQHLNSRILYAHLLGRYDEATKAIVLHDLLGGDRIPLQIIQGTKVAPEKLPAPTEGTPCAVFFYRGSRNNPGRAGAGTFLYDGSLVNVEPRDNAREFLGLRSNNLAEYCAVILDSGL